MLLAQTEPREKEVAQSTGTRKWQHDTPELMSVAVEQLSVRGVWSRLTAHDRARAEGRCLGPAPPAHHSPPHLTKRRSAFHRRALPSYYTP